MWSTANYWFDLTIVLGIFAVGNILFGHFEEHRPKWRRLLKLVFVVVLALVLSSLRLRWVFGLLLSAATVVVMYIHVVWLPKHGIHGWTGEPKQRYLELMGAKDRDQ